MPGEAPWKTRSTTFRRNGAAGPIWTGGLRAKYEASCRTRSVLGRGGQAHPLVQALHAGQEHQFRPRQRGDPLVRGRHHQRGLQLHRPAPRTPAATRWRSSGRATTRPSRRTSPTASCTTRSAAWRTSCATAASSKGDRVTIYMPMIPEAAYAMLACARLGAIHSVVFGGFSPDSLASRIEDAQSAFVVTADEGLRGGRKVPLKANVDAAIDARRPAGRPRARGAPHGRRRQHGAGPRRLLRRGGRAWSSDECPVEEMNAEDPLFILYTSGSHRHARRACCTPPAAISSMRR